jgi:two-component SAPR family response regulator
LCKYLAEEWDFSYNFENEDSSEASVMGRIRPWNAMMLISNDIMRYAEESDDGTIENIDVNAMERHANQYISQQIFNILTAQAVTTDYDQNYFRRAGIDIGETIRLDANDLFMSLAGPVAIAYAESVVPETPAAEFRQAQTVRERSSRAWTSTTCSSAPSTCRTSTR